MTKTITKQVEPRVLMPAPQERAPRSIVAKMAAKYGMEAEALERTLAETIFPTGKNAQPATKAQVAALMVVADQYGLNPFTKEVYAFPQKKGGGIIPVVSIDGWLKLMNGHPQMDGIELEVEHGDDGKPTQAACTIHRKDRKVPFRKVETYVENYRKSYDGEGPWDRSPSRMLGHRATIQAIRVAFGFAGIYEPDEAEVIAGARDAEYQVVARQPSAAAAAQLEAALADEPEAEEPAEVIDPETGEVVEFREPEGGAS